MNVTCAECASIFRVDPAKVPGSGVRARCAVCGAVMAVATASAPSFDPRPAHLTPAGAAIAAPGDTGMAADAPPRGAPTSADEPADVVDIAAPASAAAPPPAAAAASQAPPAPAAAPTSAASAPTPAGPAGRRTNPYLANDPSQRARRLARALVSDLVAYHPDKREEGLRAGTLKAIFREEIRKSWEEYVAQVGAPTAESTTHFQDALNDILAGGRKVF